MNRLVPQFRYAAMIIAIMAVSALVLWIMGRSLLCQCGYLKLWHGEVLSSENSQHLADWYAPSHVVHGILFYALLRWIVPAWPIGRRAVLATAIEVAWEIVENTDMMIDRYRETTISLGYYGDSVVNSVADVAFMLLGFFLAARLPVALTVAVAIGLELLAAWVIRDNLFLNVLMLVYPLEIVRTWQAGG